MAGCVELSVAPFVDDGATPDGGDPALASATDDGTVRNGLNWNVGSMLFMQNQVLSHLQLQ